MQDRTIQYNKTHHTTLKTTLNMQNKKIKDTRTIKTGKWVEPKVDGSILKTIRYTKRRSQWPRGLKRGSAAALLLKLWFWIPPGARMSVCCDCCVWSGRGLCDELITCLEESYRLWWVVVCDLETSWMSRPWPHWGLSSQKQNKSYTKHW